MITYYTGNRVLVRNVNRIESEHYIARPTSTLSASGCGFWTITKSGSDWKMERKGAVRNIKTFLQSLEQDGV